jgi:hypothetical protein
MRRCSASPGLRRALCSEPTLRNAAGAPGRILPSPFLTIAWPCAAVIPRAECCEALQLFALERCLTWQHNQR